MVLGRVDELDEVGRIGCKKERDGERGGVGQGDGGIPTLESSLDNSLLA